MIQRVAQFNYSTWFIVFLTLTLVLFWNTRDAGLVMDFNGWMIAHNAGTWRDILTCFGYPGLHQLEHLAFHVLSRMFGMEGMGWYISFAVLHVLTALSGMALVRRLMRFFEFSLPALPILAALFFLASPYAADTVVSKVTVHYFLSANLMMHGLRWAVDYLDDGMSRHIILTCVSFALALFCLEISYIFPIMLLALTGVHLLWTGHFRKTYLHLPIAAFAIFGLYLLLHKIVIGSAIGHYGADVHLRFNLAELTSNVSRYLLSYLAFFDFWPYPLKESTTNWLMGNHLIVFIPSIILAFSIVGICLQRRIAKLWLAALLIILALLALAPVANLYYVYLLRIENDRYGYLFSFFLYSGIVLAMLSIRWEWLKWLLLLSFLVANFYFLSINIKAFEDSGRVYKGLMNDYRWFEDDLVLMLNDPDNLNGAPIFFTANPKVQPVASFAESLFLEHEIDRREAFLAVSQMNYTSPHDSIKVEKIDSMHYHITLAQWGTWFWVGHLGLVSYETNHYRVEAPNSLEYHLYLKEPARDATLIYCAGDKLSEVK